MTATERAQSNHKHSAAHPWYGGLKNNRRFVQFEEEQTADRRAIERGWLKAAKEHKPEPANIGRPNRSGIVVPFNRTKQPREYRRYYDRMWKLLRKEALTTP